MVHRRNNGLRKFLKQLNYQINDYDVIVTTMNDHFDTIVINE